MNPESFVQNVKKRCAVIGKAPTVACREAGVGTSFIRNIEARGSMPSVDRVEKLAAYLGCTVSELIGERLPEPATVPEDPVIGEIMARVAELTPDQQRLYLAQLRALQDTEGKKITVSESDTL